MTTHYGRNSHTYNGRRKFASTFGPVLAQLQTELSSQTPCEIIMFGRGNSSLYRMLALEDWSRENPVPKPWNWVQTKGESVGNQQLISTFNTFNCDSTMANGIWVWVDDLIDTGKTLEKATETLNSRDLLQPNSIVGALVETIVMIDDSMVCSYEQHFLDFLIGTQESNFGFPRKETTTLLWL